MHEHILQPSVLDSKGERLKFYEITCKSKGSMLKSILFNLAQRELQNNLYLHKTPPHAISLVDVIFLCCNSIEFFKNNFNGPRKILLGMIFTNLRLVSSINHVDTGHGRGIGGGQPISKLLHQPYSVKRITNEMDGGGPGHAGPK